MQHARMGDDVLDADPRTTCLRCRRPTSHCYCALIPSIETKMRVLFVQHPRERDVPIGTARMAHLALPRSVLISSVIVDEDPRVQQAIDEGNAAVLYPAPDAMPVEDWQGDPPRTLFIVDGTWSQAKKLLKKNPRLASLPRLSLSPEKPGNYRIRKEPSDKHLATIEAVVHALAHLEGGDRARFDAILRPFDYMVDRQVEHAEQSGRGRHRKREGPRGSKMPELEPLREDPTRAVVVYAEGNCHPRDGRAPGAPEVLQVVASRPFTDPPARYATLLKPRRPLGRDVDARLGVSVAAIEAGEDVAAALARFSAFAGPHPIYVCWGTWARDLLAQEGFSRFGFVDLRALAARRVGRSAGGIEPGAVALGVAEIDHMQRAERRIHILDGMLRALCSPSLSAPFSRSREKGVGG
jgi:DTW domain-containing protein